MKPEDCMHFEVCKTVPSCLCKEEASNSRLIDGLSVEVIKYLEDNLEISVEQVTEFGPVEVIKVTLELGGKVISESDCSLPDRDT